MTKFVAFGLVAVLAAALAGCGDGVKTSQPPPAQQNASEMFDKKEMPRGSVGKSGQD
jgi:hypothetical protein